MHAYSPCICVFVYTLDYPLYYICYIEILQLIETSPSRPSNLQTPSSGEYETYNPPGKPRYTATPSRRNRNKSEAQELSDIYNYSKSRRKGK